MKMLWDLFFSFFKVGLFTFGGGAAMLPLLQAEFVERRKWVTDSELMDFYSIGQCTPGIIAINTATFVGYKKQGKIGAIAATLGIVTPSLIIILLVASILSKYMHNPYVIHAFAGIRIVVVALILDAVVRLWKQGVKGRFGWGMFALSLLLLVAAGLSPVMIVIVAGVAGYAFQLYLRRKRS